VITSITTSPSSDSITAWFKRVSNKFSDFSIPNKAASIILDRWVQVNFKTEGGKVGNWKKSDAAIARNGMTLQKTGNLKDKFSAFYDKNDAGIGTEVPYSLPHEKGLYGLPIRRMLPTSNEAWKAVKPAYEKFVEGATKGWPK